MVGEGPRYDGPRRAAVLGHPVEHSLSPALHNAAFRALGLDDWHYEAIDCPEGELAAVIGRLGPEFVGFSVTMPGKPEALAYADEISDRAALVGSVNTLVRRDGAWFADCTDIDGASGALREFPDLITGTGPGGPSAVVLGVGGTARPVIAGLADAGFTSVLVASRRPNADQAMQTARAVGLEVDEIRLEDPELDSRVADADLLVNTIPAHGSAALADLAGRAARVFDVLYHPWPTPMAAVALEAGTPVVGGDVMLLNQAFGQSEQFTGRSAPREAMTTALRVALAERD